MKPAMLPDWKRMSITDRLRVLRKVYDLNQQQMAMEIGVDPGADTYGKAERTGQIAQLAPKIYTRFAEIDAGWLFQGKTGNISQAAEKRLSQAASILGLVGRNGD